MVSAKDFFSKIDLSKLDTASATQIREEFLTLSPEDWDLIDNDSEMQKQMEIIKDRIEKEFPTALGLKSNEEKASESIQKVNETNLEKSKIKVSEIEKQKEALRKEQEEFEAEKAKFANDIEEMQMLIELTQDTLNDNPNDEDLPMYLELLNDTLQGIISGQKDLLSKKKNNKTAFANGGELIINDTDIASDNEISALLEKIEKDWGKASDYYSTIEGIIVGYSKSDSDSDMYLNANGIKRINEELANFDFQYRLTSNGIVDIEELEEDKSNLYVYRFHEERGEIKASVEDMTTGIAVWEYNYPDYSLGEEEREFQSTIVEDGFMKNFDDVEGLENYLKDLQILPMDAELISAEDAIQDYGYYANGGSIFSNSNHNTGRSWHLDRQRYNSNEDWEKPLRKRKRKYKNGGSVVDNDIIYAYKQIEKEKQRILSGLTVPYKESFGDVNINVEDVFTENGSEELKYENVGYGGIRFMGNINGKVPTQGLYYKDSQTKNKIQNVIRALDQNNEDKRSIVDDIIKQKGKPKEQLAVLNMMAKRLENGGLADAKTHEYRVMYSYKSRDGVDTDSFQDEESARNFYNEKIKEDDIELVMFDYNEYNKLGYVSKHRHISAYSWKDTKFENGGILNNYEGKNSEEVWNNWTREQKIHFIKDHYSNSLEYILETYPNLEYSDFKTIEGKDGYILDLLQEHINEGQYSNGGGVDEIKVGDTVNLSEIKMPNGEIQYERVENGIVKYIGEGIYGVENPKTRRIHQVRKDQIEGYENDGGVDYEKHYSSSPINEQSFDKLKSMLNNAGFSHYKNTPENQLKHGNRGDIAIIGKSSVIVSHYTPNTNRFLDSKTFETEIELAKFLDKNDFYKDGGNIYPVEDARKPMLNSGVILLVKDTKEEADKYIVGIPDLFVAPYGDKWAIKKFENGGEMSSTPMYKKGDEVVLFAHRYNPNADIFLVDEYIKFDLGAKQHYYKLKNKNSGEFYERYENAIIPASDLQKDLSTEEKTKLEAIYEKYHNSDYWGYGDSLKSQLNSWRNAYAKGDKGALKYTEQDIIDNMWMREKMDFDKIVNSVRDMVSKKDLAMMISRLRYDQKVSLEIYEVLTGEKIKGMSNKELSQYFTSKYGS